MSANWVTQTQFVDQLIEASLLFPDAIGFQRLTNAGELVSKGEPCEEGCLASGSSSHYHSEFIGWRVIFKDHIMEVDANLVPYKDSIIHKPMRGDTITHESNLS